MNFLFLYWHTRIKNKMLLHASTNQNSPINKYLQVFFIQLHNNENSHPKLFDRLNIEKQLVKIAIDCFQKYEKRQIEKFPNEQLPLHNSDTACICLFLSGLSVQTHTYSLRRSQNKVQFIRDRCLIVKVSH